MWSWLFAVVIKAAQRKAAERSRKREAGLVPVQEWVHREDAPRLRKYAIRLRAARIVDTEQQAKQ